MGENFMSTITQIEDYASKKNQIIDKVASLLAEAIIGRIQSGTMNSNTQRDIMNAIKSFNAEEQSQILSKAIIYVGMNMNTTSKSNYKDDDFDARYNSGKKNKSRSDRMFRGFDD